MKVFQLLREEYEVFVKELSEKNGPQPITWKLQNGGVDTEKELLIEFGGPYVFLSNVPENVKVVENETIIGLNDNGSPIHGKANKGISVADYRRHEDLQKNRGKEFEKCVNEYCNEFYDPSHPYCPVCKKDRLPGVFLSFGQAIDALKAGKKVKREAWGGYWFIPNHAPLRGWEPNSEVRVIMNGAIIAKLKDDGGYAPAQPYQADLLAEDWLIVE